MKHLRKMGALLIVCLLIMQTVFISGFTTLADSSSADSSLPITYELYDYFEDADASRIAGTAITSDSPWKFQAKPQGGAWTDWLNTASLDGSYTYWCNSDKAWGNYPGIAYHMPADRSGRYYQNYITPTNSAGDASWKIDAAYVFTASASGSYTFGKGNQDKSASWDLCNYFKQYDQGQKLDFGVRITMNNKILWNGDASAEKREGFAVFGTNTAKAKEIEIPFIEGIIMNEGDVLRVEFTAFDAADGSPWTLRLTGTVSMKFVSRSTKPTVFPVEYELYDYYDAVESARKNHTAIESTSPWSVQAKLPGADWINWPNTSNQGSDMWTFAYNSDKAWGNYPGFAYYYPEDRSGRYYLGVITPTQSLDPSWKIDTAYTFTVPYDGIYTIRPCNQDKSISWTDTNNFKQMDTCEKINFGVRITKNGEVIWNGDANTEKQDGFAVFGTNGALAESVPVPTLSSLSLKFGDVVRVEFTTFTAIGGNPWAQRIHGLVGMTYNGPADVKEAQKVSWKDTGVLTDYSASTTLAANGKMTNNNFNATNKSVSLTLMDVKAGEPVEVTLGGYVLRIAGDASYIYKHHDGADDFRYIMLPVAADGKYDVTVTQQGLYNYISGTEELSDNLVGARFTATVNGTTFSENFSVLDTTSASFGVNNLSTGAIRISGAPVAFAEGQPCHVDRATNVVYAKYGLNGTRIRYYMEDSDGVTIEKTAATGGIITKADTVENFVLAVGGDVNGDAKVNVKDLIRMKKGALGNVTLSDAQKYAATFGKGYELNADALTGFRREILVTEELPISLAESYKLYAGATSNDVSANLLTNLTVSGGSKVNGYDHNGNRSNAIYTLSSDGTTSGAISQRISNPGKGVYVMSGWSSSSDFFRGDATEYYSYSLYAQVVYSDGVGEEFYVSFSDGNHDWEYRETSFVVRENASAINFYVFLRDPVRATAKFEGMSLVRGLSNTKTVQDLPMIDQNVAVDTEETSRFNTQDGFGLAVSDRNVTGVYVNGTNIAASVAGTTQSGFMVRDIADASNSVYSFGTTTTDGENFNGLQDQIGLELDANYTAEEDCVHITGTIKDLTRDFNGRAVQLSYAIPLSATGWSFQPNLNNAFSVNGAVYKYMGWNDGSWMTVVDWDSEAHSYYPAAALTCGDYGIGIAADMDFPTYWELEYNATTNQLVITYQLGITSEAPEAAKFGFTLYKLDDPTWGFRSAMSKYTKIHPEYYETRATDHGAWVAWQDLSNVPNIADFNLQFKQAGFDTVAQADIDNGMQTLRYIELGDWWLSNLEAQTNDAILKKVAEHAKEGDVTEKGRQAIANEFCKALNVDGSMVCNYVDRAWAPSGAQIHINPNPNLPGKWNFFNLYYSESNLKLWFDEKYVQGAGTFDGIYLDESSGFWVGNANFNKAHFKYTTVPLTYSPTQKRAMLHRASNSWEAVKALRDDLHNRNKILFANKCPDRNAFFTTQVDAMGNEQTVTNNGAYAPLSIQMLSDWRALAYNKAFCLLNSNDWNVIKGETLEKWISRCMLYGIIVSPHDTYNETTEWTQYFTCSKNYFERDREIWKRYNPAVKTISEAGWEAVTGAYVNNGNVLVERFGDKTEDGATYVVLYNNTDAYQDVTVSVDTNVVGSFTSAQEIVWNNAKPVSGNQITMTLNPGVSYVLKLS